VEESSLGWIVGAEEESSLGWIVGAEEGSSLRGAVGEPPFGLTVGADESSFSWEVGAEEESAFGWAFKVLEAPDSLSGLWMCLVSDPESRSSLALSIAAKLANLASTSSADATAASASRRCCRNREASVLKLSRVLRDSWQLEVSSFKRREDEGEREPMPRCSVIVNIWEEDDERLRQLQMIMFEMYKCRL
jgi:hypothetical protein